MNINHRPSIRFLNNSSTLQSTDATPFSNTDSILLPNFYGDFESRVNQRRHPLLQNQVRQEQANAAANVITNLIGDTNLK